MSTEFYLTCESHEPPICSDVVAWNAKGLSQLRVFVKGREGVVKISELYGYDAFDNDTNPWVKEATAAWFLRIHKNCDLGIQDDVGHSYSLEDDSDVPTPEHTKLGVVQKIQSGPMGVTIVFDSLTEEGKKLFGIE